MMKVSLAIFLTILGSALAAGGEVDPARLPPAAERKVDFRADIYPLLLKHCFRCHQGADAPPGRRLDDRSVILGEGGRKRLAVPGKSAESLLVQLVAGVIADKVMPLRGERLTAAEVGLLRSWIDQGLAWDEKLLPPPSVARDHWAFRPVVRPGVPEANDRSWLRTPIDAFLAREHEARGLHPAPEASPRTIIRRLSLDLTGLPPSPEEVEEFVADPLSAAYENLVERLLASPHYGERWGRHWLDVARFADTEGYENNHLRPYAFRYRDYVVKCFNEDRPFDRFLREQIAGDELLPYSDENLIATGFLAACRLSGNQEDKGVQRNDMLVDVANAAASGFLGFTLACAQCHDHKFDPISQRDYYRFHGYFVQGQVNNLLLKNPALWKAYEEAIPPEYTAAQGLRKLIHDRTRAKLVEAGDKDPPPEKIEKAIAEEDQKLSTELKKKVEALAKKLPDKPQTWGFYSPATSPTPVDTLSIKGDFALPYKPDELRRAKPQVLVRGDVHRPGDALEAGWPEVLGPAPAAASRSGSRQELADWLTSPSNPLTARVWVNRIWHYHFGRGLVHDPGDFGVKAPRPALEELLDWLAAELVASGWSTKRIHRLIVLSSAYREASRHDPECARIDPECEFYWRWMPRRLEAEAVRDAALASSGELDRTAGGPPVEPNDEKALRRSIYLLQKRDHLPEGLKLFDLPPASESCAHRHVSTVALQPLYLLNGPFLQKRAEALAKRARERASGDALKQVEAAFTLALSRPPGDDESQEALAYVARVGEGGLERLAHALLNLNEFVYLD